MIQLKKLSKLYRTEDIETTALNNISLTIAEGEFVSIMGPSGCGKSTLLNILGMLDASSSGAYRFKDHDVTELSERDRVQVRKQNIGFVFQSFNLIDELTVLENVELPLIYHNLSNRVRLNRAENALDRMGLNARRKHYPRQLSGGQQQRVAVARAMVADPKLILADEPTGNLDSNNGNEVMSLLKSLNESGTTIVMVTHSELFARVCSRTIRLFDGMIVTGSDDEVDDAHQLH